MDDTIISRGSMTADEVLANYRSAANKKKQIGVLAQLCCCKTEEMRQWLEARGEAVPGETAKRIPSENKLELYEQGLTDREIAKALGVTRSAISQWRCKLGLPENTSRESDPEAPKEESKESYSEPAAPETMDPTATLAVQEEDPLPTQENAEDDQYMSASTLDWVLQRICYRWPLAKINAALDSDHVSTVLVEVIYQNDGSEQVQITLR